MRYGAGQGFSKNSHLLNQNLIIYLPVNDKIYNVKNIPMKMLNMGEKKVACYIAEQIIVYEIQEGIFNYEKFLLE